MIDPYFLIVALSSFGLALIFTYATRGVHFFGTDTDTEKQAQVAAHSHKWKWPSDMHKSEYAKTKTYMKDVVILVLAIFQKILRDKTTDHPLLVLSAFANALVAVLIYVIAVFWWGPVVALFASLLFLLSLWVWQIALIGGHITVAMALFLFSIVCTQQASVAIGVAQFYWLLVGGLSFGMTQFASASSRKFYALFFGALVFAKYGHFFSPDRLPELIGAITSNHHWIINIVFPAAVVLSLIILALTYKRLVKAIYEKRAPKLLHRVINARESFSLEHYLSHASKQMKEQSGRIIVLLLFFLFLVNFVGLDYLVPLFVGFFVAVLIFIVPNFKVNLRNYFNYYYLPKGSKNRFRMYNNYFNSIGKPIPFARDGKPVERTGWDWVVKYLWRMIPFHVVLFVAGFCYFIYISLRSEAPFFFVTTFLLVVALSLSPIAWGEFTKGPQIGRSYSPGFLGIILFIGFAASIAQFTHAYFWHFAFSFLAIGAVWAFWVFARDVYPARVATRSLTRLLSKLGATTLYTYDTTFSDAFVHNMLPSTKENLEIIYVSSLDDAPKDSYFAVPGTSHKALTMESGWEGIKEGDYRKDPVLNDLLDSGSISGIALARFKTFGSSPYWVHESEITSYRDLIIREITKDDRFRGLAWLLKV